MSAPRLLVTDASGFVGRHLIDHLKDDYRIVGIARRSQRRAGIADDPNVTWLEADIAERAQLEAVFRTIAETGGADYAIHLAAYCDFTGFAADEFCGAVELLNLICMRVLRRDPTSDGMRQQILDYLTMTLRFGCDQAQETFEELSLRRVNFRLANADCRSVITN